MGRNRKLDPETRLKAVREYLQGTDSSGNIAKRYGISAYQLQYLGRVYQAHGAQGLEETKQNRSYTLEFKLMVVREYLEGAISLKELAIKHKIPSHQQIRQWLKAYNGHKTLKGYKPAGGIRMTKGRKTTYEERIEIVEDCLKNGQDYQMSADKYNVSYTQIYSWVKKYNERGVAGLKDSRGKGKDLEDMTEFERLQAENRLLKARLERLEIEAEIKKKLEEHISAAKKRTIR